MTLARQGDFEICYQEFGVSDDPLLVLIPGLGSQMLLYPVELCQGFIDRGFRVVRFDNRDVGLSTRCTEPYGIDDMAADAVAVIDACAAERAHVVGLSLGGMISQTVAARHPDRTASMTSIGSGTGNPDFQQPSAEVLDALLEPAVTGSVDEIIESDVRARSLWASPEWYDEDETRAYFRAAYDRSPPDGAAYQRQLDAVTGAGNRDDVVATIGCPSLVVHGSHDTLLPAAAGEHTAALIDGAEWLLIDGMGHDLPVQVWPQVISAVTALAARAPQA